MKCGLQLFLQKVSRGELKELEVKSGRLQQPNWSFNVVYFTWICLINDQTFAQYVVELGHPKCSNTKKSTFSLKMTQISFSLWTSEEATVLFIIVCVAHWWWITVIRHLLLHVLLSVKTSTPMIPCCLTTSSNSVFCKVLIWVTHCAFNTDTGLIKCNNQKSKHITGTAFSINVLIETNHRKILSTS